MPFSEEAKVLINRIVDAFDALQKLGEEKPLTLGPLRVNADMEDPWFDGLYYGRECDGALFYDGPIYPDDPEIPLSVEIVDN